MLHIYALTAEDLLKAIDIDSDKRSHNCTSNLVGFDYDKGILRFVTNCAGSRSAWEQTVILTDWDMLKEELEAPPAVEEEVIEEEPVEEIIEEPEEEPLEEILEEQEEPVAPLVVPPVPTKPVEPPTPHAPSEIVETDVPEVEPEEEEEEIEIPPTVPTPQEAPGTPPRKIPTPTPKPGIPTRPALPKAHKTAQQKMSWEQVKKALPEVLLSDVKLQCGCPAYQYQGAHYLLDQLDSAITPETRFPSVRDPNNEHVLCKHLIAVLRRFF